jgi:hypothetical protein
VPQNGIYQLAIGYGNVPLGQTSENNLRLMKVAAGWSLQTISSSDCGNQLQTSKLGDFGVDTSAKKVWANVDTLGTFAVGVPKVPVEVVTTIFSGAGCPIMTGMVLMLLTAGVLGLNTKDSTRK